MTHQASRPSERVSLLATTNRAAGTGSIASAVMQSKGVLGRNFHQFAAVVDNNSDQTATVSLLRAQGSATDETNTALIQSATVDSNEIVQLNYNPSETNTSEPYIALKVAPADTGDTETSIFGAVYGHQPRYGPASDFDVASLTVTNI